MCVRTTYFLISLSVKEAVAHRKYPMSLLCCQVVATIATSVEILSSLVWFFVFLNSAFRKEEEKRFPFRVTQRRSLCLFFYLYLFAFTNGGCIFHASVPIPTSLYRLCFFSLSLLFECVLLSFSFMDRTQYLLCVCVCAWRIVKKTKKDSSY